MIEGITAFTNSSSVTKYIKDDQRQGTQQSETIPAGWSHTRNLHKHVLIFPINMNIPTH